MEMTTTLLVLAQLWLFDSVVPNPNLLSGRVVISALILDSNGPFAFLFGTSYFAMHTFGGSAGYGVLSVYTGHMGNGSVRP